MRKRRPQCADDFKLYANAKTKAIRGRSDDREVSIDQGPTR